MTAKVRWCVLGVSLVAVLGLVCRSESFFAEGKDLEGTVKKIAASLAKGDAAGAKTSAEKVAKGIEDTSDLMHLFKPRNKGGLGWGSTTGKNPAEDGLEKKILAFAKAVPAAAASDVANNVEAANWIAAMAEVTLAKAPTKNASGGKTIKAWTDSATEMRAAAQELAKAAAGKNAAQIKAASEKVSSSCNSCHSKFK